MKKEMLNERPNEMLSDELNVVDPKIKPSKSRSNGRWE